MSHVFEPNRGLSKEARIKNMCEYKELCIQADEDFEGYWDKLAREKLEWFKPYDRVLNEDNAPFYKWFEGGKLNVTHQCLGRHLKTRKNKAAIIWEGEDGKRETTYTLSPDRQRLTLSIRLSGGRLPGPLGFQATYRRKGTSPADKAPRATAPRGR